MGLYFLGLAFGLVGGFFFGAAYEVWCQLQLSAAERKKVDLASPRERWSALLLPQQRK
jgi:hypothetical protein